MSDYDCHYWKCVGPTAEAGLAHPHRIVSLGGHRFRNHHRPIRDLGTWHHGFRCLLLIKRAKEKKSRSELALLE